MAKMKRCYTCGYEELNLSRVVYCVNCEETMVHRYCMDPPRHGDEEFDWVCEICCPRVYKQSKSRRTSEYLSSKLESEAKKRNPRRRLKRLGDKSHDRQEDPKKSLGGLEEFAAELESLETPLDVYDDQPIGDEDVSGRFTDARSVEELSLHSISNDLGAMKCDLKAKESLQGTNITTQKEGSADLEQVSSQTSNGTHEGRGQSLKDQDPTKCPPLQEPETDLRCKSNCSPQSENLSSCLPPVSRLHKPSSPLVNVVNSHPTEEKEPGICVNKGSDAQQPTLGVGKYQLIPREGDGSQKLIESFLPISHVSWSGTCHVTHKMHGMSVELEAHLSNSANFKVSDAARALPLPLDLELVDKFSAWPERFLKDPPCGNDIGLYFFPSQADDRKAYDDLLGKMILDDLVLRFTTSDLRLMVFSSLELPKGTQRFRGKLYLWGAFSAPLSLPSSEEVNIHCLQVPSPLKENSCLGEDLASNKKGQGSSNTIQPTQQNAQSNDQRVSGCPSSSPSRPVSEMETRHESTLPVQNSPHSPHQAGPQRHDCAANGKGDGLRDPDVRSNPDTQIEGGKNSASIKKRKRGRAEFPDQGRKLDAPGNFKFFPGAKQKRKNKQKQKNKMQNQKQWHSPCKKCPLDKAPKQWHSRHEPRTTSSVAEHSVAMNGSFSPHQTPQSNPRPQQVPCFPHHEMPVNRNWNGHSHPQPYALPVAEQPHPQQYAGFPGMAMSGWWHPQTGWWHPQPYTGGYPSGQQAMWQPHPQQHANLPAAQQAMPVVGSRGNCP